MLLMFDTRMPKETCQRSLWECCRKCIAKLSVPCAFWGAGGKSQRVHADGGRGSGIVATSTYNNLVK